MSAILAATGVDKGDTAWMLAATALVLLMTPALGLFYAGLVREKNTLNTFMMCVAALSVATICFALVGYSIAFDGDGSLFGGLGNVFLQGVGFEPRDGTTIPHLLFFAFQTTFCIITTALVSGAVVERMRFGPFLVFAALWSVLVYSVLAHWAFGGGWLQAGGTLDFAGGIPVEMGSGFSAAGGFISPGWAIVLGAVAALPSYGVIVWRARTRVDKTLDVLAAHGIAGLTGIVFIGFVAQISWNGVSDGLLYGNAAQLGSQLLAVLAAPAYAFGATYALLTVMGRFTALRGPDRDEAVGMDIVHHGEEAYVRGEGAILITPDGSVEDELKVPSLV